MYIEPKEYLKEIKNQIKRLKKELSELEAVQSAMIKAGITEDETPVSDAPKKVEAVKTKKNKELTHAQKISESQKIRHRKRRDAKIPIITEYIKANGASSTSKLSAKLKITTDALKLIFAENPDKFKKNQRRLWELKN